MRTTEHVRSMATVFGLLRCTESLSELKNDWMMVVIIQVRPCKILSKLTLGLEEWKSWITVFQSHKRLSNGWNVMLLEELDELIDLYPSLRFR